MLARSPPLRIVCGDTPLDRLMADLQFSFKLKPKPVGGFFWAQVSRINLSTSVQLSDENYLPFIHACLRLSRNDLGV